MEARQHQVEIDRLASELVTKMTELELLYHRKKLPLYNTRNNLLKNANGFWLKVIEHHPSTSAWLSSRDRLILQFLDEVVVTEVPNEPKEHVTLTEGGDPENDVAPPAHDEHSRSLYHHFRLEWHLRANDYMYDKVLWRDISHNMEESLSGVNWHSGQSPQEPSIFNFFEPSNLRPEENKLSTHLGHEIGHVFRYEFWANPFTYFDQPSFQNWNQEGYSHFDPAQGLPTEALGDYEAPPLPDDI